MPPDDGKRLFAEMLVIPADFATQARLIRQFAGISGPAELNSPRAQKIEDMTELATRQNPLWILISERHPTRTTPLTHAANRGLPRQTA